MKLSPEGFDPSRGCLTFGMECQMLKKYYDLFENLINESVESGGIGIEKSSSNSVKITIPLSNEEKEFTNNENSEDGGLMKVAIDVKKVRALYEVVNKFIEQSLRTELRCVEFIPLEGYSWDSMREDIHQAIKNKRDFCVIQDYDEFLAMESDKKYVFHQKMVSFGTDEYADVAIMVYKDEQEKMKSIFVPQLELVDWC